MLGLVVGDGGDKKEDEEVEVEEDGEGEKVFEPELDQLEEEVEKEVDTVLNKKDMVEKEKEEEGEEEKYDTASDAKSQFFAGAVPKLIYNQAIDSCCDGKKLEGMKIKDDGFDLRLKFLRAVDGFKDFLGVEKVALSSIGDDSVLQSAFPDVATFILTDIATRFPFDPRAWRVLSSRPMMVIESFTALAFTSESNNGTMKKKKKEEEEEEEEENLLFVVDKEGDKSLGIVKGIEDEDVDDNDDPNIKTVAEDVNEDDDEEEEEDLFDDENDIGNGIRASLSYSSLQTYDEWVNKVNSGSLDTLIAHDCFDLVSASVAGVFNGQGGGDSSVNGEEKNEEYLSSIGSTPRLHLSESGSSWEICKVTEKGDDKTKEKTPSTMTMTKKMAATTKTTMPSKQAQTKRMRSGVEGEEEVNKDEEMKTSTSSIGNLLSSSSSSSSSTSSSLVSGALIRIAPSLSSSTTTTTLETSSFAQVATGGDSSIDEHFFSLVRSSLKKSTSMISVALTASSKTSSGKNVNDESSGSASGPSKKVKRTETPSRPTVAPSSSSSSSLTANLQLQLGLYCVSAELHLVALSAIDAYKVRNNSQGHVLRFTTARAVLTSLVEVCVRASVDVPTVTSKVERNLSSALELVLMQARVRLGLVRSALNGLEKACSWRLRGDEALCLAKTKLSLAVAAAASASSAATATTNGSVEKSASIITSASEKEKDELMMNVSVELLDSELFPWKSSMDVQSRGSSRKTGLVVASSSSSSSSSSLLTNVILNASETLRTGLSITSGGVTSSESALPLWISLLELSSHNSTERGEKAEIEQAVNLFHEASLALSAQSVEVQDSLKMGFLRIISRKMTSAFKSLHTAEGQVGTVTGTTSAELGKALRWVTTPSSSVSIHEAAYRVVSRSTLLLVKQFAEARSTRSGGGGGGGSSSSFSIASWKPLLVDAVTQCRKTLDVCASVHGKEAIGLWSRALKFERAVAKHVPSSFFIGGGGRKDGATDVYERALSSLNDSARALFCAKNV